MADFGILGLTFGLAYSVVYLALLVLRVVLVPSITISAYRNGRSVLFWGILAMIVPIVALVCFMFLGNEKKRDVCYAWKDCAKKGK